VRNTKDSGSLAVSKTIAIVAFAAGLELAKPAGSFQEMVFVRLISEIRASLLPVGRQAVNRVVWERLDELLWCSGSSDPRCPDGLCAWALALRA
jgi:hypothetical protein